MIRGRSLLRIAAGALVLAACTSGDNGDEEALPRADATCVTDATEALNQLLRRADEGAVIRLQRGGCYRTTGPVRIGNRRGLRLEGNGALIDSRRRPQTGERINTGSLMIVNSSDVIVRGLRVKGAASGPPKYRKDVEGQHGIEVRNSANVTLETVEVTDVNGDFVYLGGKAGRDRNRNVTVRDSTFARAGRQGMAITTAADGVVFTGNTMEGVALNAFDVEVKGDADVVRNVRIEGNTIQGPGTYMVAISGKGRVDGYAFVTNRLPLDPLRFEMKADVNKPRPPRSNIVVAGNVAGKALDGAAITIACTTGGEVRDNTQPFEPAARATAVRLAGATGITVGPNNFPGAARQSAVVPDDCAGATAEPKD